MLLLLVGVIPLLLADRLTVSHYENKLNRMLGGRTSALHPGKVKRFVSSYRVIFLSLFNFLFLPILSILRYRCIEEYVDIDPPADKSVLEFKAWHKVRTLFARSKCSRSLSRLHQRKNDR